MRREKELAAAKAKAPAEPVGESNAMKQKQKELSWDDVTPIDVVGLEIGYRLIPLVDKAKGGELLNRVKGVRKKMSQDPRLPHPGRSYKGQPRSLPEPLPHHD